MLHLSDLECKDLNGKSNYFFSYKVVMSIFHPVGNNVELRDLRPFTVYHLEVWNRLKRNLIGSVDFSTASKLIKIII